MYIDIIKGITRKRKHSERSGHPLRVSELAQFVVCNWLPALWSSFVHVYKYKKNCKLNLTKTFYVHQAQKALFQEDFVASEATIY